MTTVNQGLCSALKVNLKLKLARSCATKTHEPLLAMQLFNQWLQGIFVLGQVLGTISELLESTHLCSPLLARLNQIHSFSIAGGSRLPNRHTAKLSGIAVNQLCHAARQRDSC